MPYKLKLHLSLQNQNCWTKLYLYQCHLSNLEEWAIQQLQDQGFQYLPKLLEPISHH